MSPNEEENENNSYQDEQYSLAIEILQHIHRKRLNSQESTVFNYHDIYENVNSDGLNNYEELRKSEKNGNDEKESKDSPDVPLSSSENINPLLNFLFRSWDSPGNDNQDTRGVAVSEVK